MPRAESTPVKPMFSLQKWPSPSLRNRVARSVLRVYTGRVVRKATTRGAKSERHLVLLDTGSRSYILQRHGQNPFLDVELEALVGKRLVCSGEEHNGVLTLENWSEQDPSTKGR